jgi:hypothetical protein
MISYQGLVRTFPRVDDDLKAVSEQISNLADAIQAAIAKS